ncbi:MAG TPA: ABC transporter permease [Hyphomicrobiales bacterium]|nr:ABC transporter permease [Hyphomicrobiales bacterium]
MVIRAQKAAADYPPACHIEPEDGVTRLVISGDWTLPLLNRIQEITAKIGPLPQGGRKEIDLGGLGALDTAGAMLLTSLRRGAGAAVFVNADPDHRILLEEVGRATERPPLPPPWRQPFVDFIKGFLITATAIERDAIRLTAFLGEASAALARVVATPSRFRVTALFHHIQQTGLNAVPIISLVCFLIGGVIMQQGARQLRNFGAEPLSIDMLAILALREVGVVLAAVMVAGRSASAFTAQIGTMKMREEIDAMRTLGIDPIETLVVPRILALIVALPLLVFLADIMCLVGGAAMAKIYLELDIPVYLERLNAAVDAKHFYVGLIKAPFAALVIGLVGCLEGMSVAGSAESVGTQVTTAVVKAIFLVLVLDGVFAIFLSASGF